MTVKNTRSQDVLIFLAESDSPVTTAQVSFALNISVYQAMYCLRQLASYGVQEIHSGKGVPSRWQLCVPVTLTSCPYPNSRAGAH
ncbi:FaeA/PapI family transcriptional regulator, partial [Aeromonas sobria]|uniref:FaeA/PapI family transcriptional regulator n=1 Tax=Aeromonas sobria TaxID=646 RepID=UPI001396A7B8